MVQKIVILERFTIITIHIMHITQVRITKLLQHRLRLQTSMALIIKDFMGIK
jgi:plasmid maintenance system antidote protein VapI